jgi:hypothetical protein
MRDLQEEDTSNRISPQVLSALQFHLLNKPLLPNLKTLALSIRDDYIPLIPYILSPRTTAITMRAFENLPEVVLASMITALPTLCPGLQSIILYNLPKTPIITAALSRFLLTTNRNILEHFWVACPLLEEAREVLYKLPGLNQLQTMINGSAGLPTLVLPGLIDLSIGYDHGYDWLQGFRGASLGYLDSLQIFSESDSVDGFLEEFESVALTTSISKTLLAFSFHTPRAWRPNYRSLLPFTKLEGLVIQFSCRFGCSSTIDDDTITDLARAMPKLETLHIGGSPCGTPAGITTKGLSALAHYCVRLSDLRIHFQVASLAPLETPAFASHDEWSVLMEDCALTVLDAGDTPVPEESALMVALTLLRIFPRLRMMRGGRRSRMQFCSLVNSLITQVRNPPLLHLYVPLIALPQGREKHLSGLSGHEIRRSVKESSNFTSITTHFRIYLAQLVAHVRSVPPFNQTEHCDSRLGGKQASVDGATSGGIHPQRQCVYALQKTPTAVGHLKWVLTSLKGGVYIQSRSTARKADIGLGPLSKASASPFNHLYQTSFSVDGGGIVDASFKVAAL